MQRLIGESALWLALLVALSQFILPQLGYWRKNIYCLASARVLCLLQFFLVATAYATLTYAFAINDFSIAYVAHNSHPTLPLIYRLTALWGAHEGSILLWIFMLNLWSLVFALTAERQLKSAPDLYTLTLSLLGLISFCFLCFLIFTSNPFLLAPTSLNGADLNPLLQDAGFIIHPPMLYAGYVGFSVAFAITEAALITGNFNHLYAEITRRYSLAAWGFLTFGITLGSWWAYRVLGWGGFWFWDPVENASLLPWLSGTALLHVLVLFTKRGSGTILTVILASLCFALSLLGTFLVRSGVLISAHTFANDPSRGMFLLLVLAIILIAALTLLLLRLPVLEKIPGAHFLPLSRESSLLMNCGLLLIAMLTVLLGTLYPLIADALGLGALSVGPPYFNSVLFPLVLITLLMMGLGVLCHWQQMTFSELWQKAWHKLALALCLSIIIIYVLTHQLPLLPTLCLALSLFIMLSLFKTAKLLPGMTLAHLGFAVALIGILLSSLLSLEKTIAMKPGDISEVGPYRFLFVDSIGIAGPNYRAIQGAFEVMKENKHIVNLYPQKRIYMVRKMVMTTVAIHPGIFRDLYLALGDPLEGAAWSVRIYYKPFMRWIWLGGLLMLIGSMIAIFQRHKLRVDIT